MSATVHQLPATTTMTVDMALDSAKARNLESVLIVGFSAGGEQVVVRSSRMSRADALYLVKHAELHVLQPVVAGYAHADKE